MRNFLLRLSVYSFLIFSILNCSATQKTADSANAFTTEIKNQYFSDKEQEYFYRTQIEVYGNEITGMLIVKKIAENTHRIVMTGDFGNKMLDAEITASEFKINYIVAGLDRSVVKKVLEKDFRTLVNESYSATEISSDKTHDVYRAFDKKNGFELHFEKASGILTQIIVTENGREQSFFSFEAKNPIFADWIEIRHQDIRLNILLKSIKE